MLISFGVPVIMVLLKSCEFYNNPFATTVVYGWGQKGHEIVGNVASALLSKSALRQIELLLNVSSTNHTTIRTSSASDAWMNQGCVEYCTPLAIVADWADQVRIYKKWSAPLHYIDIRDDIIVPNGCPVVTKPWDENFSTENTWLPNAKGHYTKCSFSYTRDCPNNICAAGAIMNYTKQLRQGYTSTSSDNGVTASIPTSALKESLMFLVHFMGDIHQPLHCSRTTDRGGNNIHVHYYHPFHLTRQPTTTAIQRRNTYDALQPPRHGRQLSHSNEIFARQHHSNIWLSKVPPSISSHHKSLNLHAVWDDSIIETILEHDFQDSRNAFEVSLLLYIHDIRTKHPSIYNNLWLRCSDATDIHCVSIWGEESFDLAMQYAYANVDGSEIVDGTTLDEQYYMTRNPIVRTQLAIAAVRLAATLEQIFT
jgi:hypothetical protein